MAEDKSPARFRLYLITDRRLAAVNGGLIAAVEGALAAGAEIGPAASIGVQLREKDLEGRALYELALALERVCSRFGAPLIVNDRVDVAIAAGAHGVHLSSTSFAVADARTLLGSSRLIGVSTHNLEEVTAAAVNGADFAVFGPVYDPLSKGAYGPAKGLSALANAVTAAKPVPVYALGGINESRASEITTLPSNSRPFGVAAIGAVFGSANPGVAVRGILRALSRP
ncbi:MAG: thiamine phosphate synthase [Deltaproteobacteria bacterium]|nr:thiamine phosphate synthase [Deltaproteobacteria bacterium]